MQLLQDVSLFPESNMALYFLSLGIEENLGRDQLYAVSLRQLFPLMDISEQNIGLALVITIQLSQDGGHFFAGDARPGAEIRHRDELIGITAVAESLPM